MRSDLKYKGGLCLLLSTLLMANGLAEETERGTPWEIHIIDQSSRGADGAKLADVDGDGLQDIATGWEEGGRTRIYHNPGPDHVKQLWPAITVGDTPQVEDAAWIDLDRDGRLEVVSCCEGKSQTVFVHWPPATKPFQNEWRQEFLPSSQRKMMWMFATPAQLDQQPGMELVAAGKGKGAQIGWFQPGENPRELANYQWKSLSPAGWIMSLFAIDMDGDGDQDLLTTDRKGKLRGCRWLENPGDLATSTTSPWKNHWVGGRDREVMFAHVADLDQDGLRDILVVTRIPDELLWFRRLDASGLKWEKQVIPFPNNTEHGKGVAVGDIDLDGQPDVVFSCGNANPPKSGMFWMSYSQQGSKETWQTHEISGPRGIKFDRIELLDLDADGDLDVLSCEERDQKKGLGVFWYENPVKSNRR
ncbi:FG-GAP repeat protein [Gimesia alba]|uniref:FG-GAP repeat protein n=1 Tax=Gimesia alba TaxID=2527973 RepID=A0A517RNS8_9PLAN|nr:VCBS repeat-containing protein [Gimesia alba]QDT45540.1 FG-GAP repeat protein [Gimesia alba]